MTQERSIEVKVGMLIIVAFSILATFVLILGGLNFERTFSMYVDFDNPGGLQTGAAVKVAGVKVGKVEAIEYRGGKPDDAGGRRALVRTKISVAERIRETIHSDADFYVTTQGVLGEQFLAIDPGSASRPVIEHDAIVRGIDPPRLDLFLAKGYELLDTTMTGIRNNREMIHDIASNTAGVLRGLNDVLSNNRDRINRTAQNVEELTAEASAMTKEARVKFVNNPKIDRTIDNIDRITTDVQKDAAPMIKDARETLANLNRVSNLVGAPEEQAKVKKAVDDVTQLAARANGMAADAQSIVAQIKTGKGTVGSLLMDEQVYDDLQEMLRDLKHNPWKILWKD